MRIVFICGSLEPGRDGVGDYTRLLAVELIRGGHHVSAVALYDRGVVEAVSGKQTLESIHLPVLRIPYALNYTIKYKIAKEWIDAYNPDFLSLQFVIFSFHYKGLPFNLNKLLSSIGKGRNWHIMFHELWVGVQTYASKKHILWGWCQREIIKYVILKLNPQVIHTQLWLYKELLSKLGFKADILPLFSNIAYASKTKDSAFTKTVATKENKNLFLVSFGALHPFSQIKFFAHEVACLAKKIEGNIVLQVLGRCGPEIEKWIAVWQAFGLKIEVLGELPPEQISKVLMNASIGVTTTALPMVQKSGSVAAMREHGLPVICISGPWSPRGIEVPAPPDGIFPLGEVMLEECISAKVDHLPHPSVSEVAQLLIQSLLTVK